jgi:3-oxoacyl-[acyl-carrier protein] reductase
MASSAEGGAAPPAGRRVAVVTGAAGTIGQGVARALAADGCSLCLVDLPDAGAQARLASLVADLAGGGRPDIVVGADVSRPAEASRIVAAASAAFGRVDVLVNVAGVTSRGYALDIDEAEWDRVMSVNLKGTFFCCQAAIPAMQAGRWGRIVNVGSINAKSGGAARPFVDPSEQARAANVAYSASKGGVHTLTICLAKELAAHGITVNAVAPGTVASPMTRAFPEALKRLIPIGRLGTADDVGAAVAFLASERAGFITGEILDVNGGVLMD